MSGKLYMLTPISSPMVTRPTSPTATAVDDMSNCAVEDHPPPAAVVWRTAASNNSKSSSSSRFRQTYSHTAAPAQQKSCKLKDGAPFVEASPFIGATAQTMQPGSPVCSAKSNGSVSSRTSSSDMCVQQRWRSPPCCNSCGAAKADAGACSGCGGKFCKACMQLEAAAASIGGVTLGRSGLGGPCSNCHSLCSACKPIACSFCEPGGSRSPARMCDACSGTCDSCKRAACGTCAASFATCSSCGYATCEECQLQSQMGREVATGGASGVGTCWCAPPLRSASNMRHISSQRYQMAHLHPSMLASSMEAVGLRDADFDDYDAYDDADGKYDSESQQLDADVLDAHHRHWAAAEGLAGLDSKTLSAVLGSIGYGLSPGSSSFSSTTNAVHGSYQGAGFAAAAAGFGRYNNHYQQHDGLVLTGSVN